MKQTYPNRVSRIRLSILPLFLILINLSACSVKLAPNYNKGIVEGIISANKDAMEFFSSIEDGTDNKAFSKREEKYDKLIGSFESLSTQVRARKIPKNNVKSKVDAVLTKRGIAVLSAADYPSADAIDKAVTSLKTLKKTDKIKDIGSGAIAPFKNEIAISVDQALTYEQFLERE